MSTLIINKYIKKLNEKLKEDSDNFFYAFRGQPDADYVLDCSASRKFDKNEKANKDLLKDHQRKLIDDLTIRGLNFSKEKQSELYDLELLADLRHYGTPSCLIDFTSNFLTALWFACQKAEGQERKSDGKIFILNCYETDKFSVVSSEKLNREIEYFFDEKFHRFWYWVPERFNQRLRDQDAVFIFGKPEIKEFEHIVIENKDKDKLCDELEKFFDYTKKTLFSDKYAIG
ncbi:MAG: FRG domain-containing protein, partial [Halobacteriovoraceae bacterium]|nr:FRG domain-containing protein [Halobacteriovoraceae bacterium]